MRSLLLLGIIAVSALVNQAWGDPPANDDFANAIPLAGTDGQVSGSLTEATYEPSESSRVADVWYRWTATQDGMVNFGADPNARVQVFENAPVEFVHSITDREPKLILPVRSGKDYYLAVSGTGSSGSFTLSYTFAADAIRIVPAVASVQQGKGPFTVFVDRIGDLSGAASVAYQTMDGSAVAGTNYTAASGTITFAPQERRRSIQIPILAGNTQFQQQFSVALKQPTNALVGTSTSTITIVDDAYDPANIAFTNATALTGGGGSTQHTGSAADGDSRTFWFRWTAPANAIARFRVNDDSPSYIGQISTGSTYDQQSWVPLTYNDDDSEDFQATAGQVYNILVRTYKPSASFTLSYQTFTSVISVDDDEVSGVRGGTATFTLRRRGNLSQSLTVSIESTTTGFPPDYVAQEGTDYTIPSKTFTFGSGAASVPITFTLLSSNAQGGKRAYFKLNVPEGPGIEGNDTLELYIRPPSTDNPNPPPANDNFASPTILAADGDSVDDDVEGSTREPGEPVHTGTGLGTVWYRWTPTLTGLARLEEYGGHATVYTGSSLTALTKVAQNSDYNGEQLKFACAAGETYQIAIESQGEVYLSVDAVRSEVSFVQNTTRTKENAKSFSITIQRQGDLSSPVTIGLTFPDGRVPQNDDFELPGEVAFAANQSTATVNGILYDDSLTQGNRYSGLTLSVTGPDEGEGNGALIIADDEDDPANNDLASATLLTGTSGTVDGTLEGADPEPEEPLTSGYASGHSASIWYQWTAPENGTVTFESVRTTVLIAYSGRTFADLKQKAVSDSNDSQVSFAAVAGNVYSLLLKGYADAYDSNEGFDSNDGYDSNDPSLSFGAIRLSYKEVTGVTPPVTTAPAGKYEGSVLGSNPEFGTDGKIALTLSGPTGFTGRLYLGGVVYTLHGHFGADGNVTVTVMRKKQSALTLHLSRDSSDSALPITGTLEDGTVLLAQIEAEHVPFSKHNHAGQAGSYTLALPLDAGSAGPTGDGYAAVKVSTSGSVRLTGALADGTKFSASAKLNEDGSAAIYAPLYHKHGSVAGRLALPSGTTDLHGSLYWTRPAMAAAAAFPAGFQATLVAVGSPYTPVKKTRALPALNATAGNALLTLDGLSFHINISAANRVSVISPKDQKLSLTVRGKTGVFTGSYGTETKHKLGGALLLNQGEGRGFSVDKSGEVSSLSLVPEPSEVQ